MSKRLFLLLPALAAVLASARDKAENWTEVHSTHFTVLTNSSEKQGRRIAGQFERMRLVFHVAFPKLQIDPESPIVVLAIKDKEDFWALEPETYLAKGSLELNGLFLRASDKNYVLMRLDAAGGHPYSVVYHEYTHLLLSKAAKMPLWLNEGLAQFYQNTDIHERDVLLGEPSGANLMLLRQKRLLPLATLFSVDENSPYYHEKNKGSIFYAESWALTHYLQLKDLQDKTSRLSQYLELLTQEVDPVNAATGAFGSLKRLQSALQTYVQQGSFNYFTLTTTTDVDDSAFEVQAITSAEADAVKADFLACYGRIADARALLDQILQEDPDNVSAQETMEFLEVLEETQVENSLRDAIKGSPSSAPTYHQLASFLRMHSRNLEEARIMALKAVSLDPANVGYRINLANILLALGRGPSAVEVLRDATILAKTLEETQAVDNVLSNAQQYAAAQLRELDQNRRLRDEAGSRKEPAAPATDVLPVTPPNGSVPSQLHRFVVGVLKGVHCDSPNLDLTVTSRANTLALHADNYFKIRFTALNLNFTGELEPCTDLENRTARVEYVESADKTDAPHLIAVELHK